MGDQAVEVGVRGSGDVQVLSADVVYCLVVHLKKTCHFDHFSPNRNISALFFIHFKGH